MSTNFNRRRGASARKARKVRLCNAPTSLYHLLPAAANTSNFASYSTERIFVPKPCGAAIRPDYNGNRCEEHRRGGDQ